MNLAEFGGWVSGEHFVSDVVGASRDLIGRTIRVSDTGHDESAIIAVIIETEAYGGRDDPASHAAFRPGGRAALMAEEPGLIYVYAAYGMYPCLNVVAGSGGTPSAVLVRGVWVDGDPRPTFGPGRTTRRLGVSMDDHGARVGDGRFAISERRVPLRIEQSVRIGITRGMEYPWRFVADTSTKIVDR